MQERVHIRSTSTLDSVYLLMLFADASLAFPQCMLLRQRHDRRGLRSRCLAISARHAQRHGMDTPTRTPNLASRWHATRRATRCACIEHIQAQWIPRIAREATPCCKGNPCTCFRADWHSSWHPSIVTRPLQHGPRDDEFLRQATVLIVQRRPWILVFPGIEHCPRLGRYLGVNNTIHT